MSNAKQVVEQLLGYADVQIDGHRPFDIQVKDERSREICGAIFRITATSYFCSI